MQISGWPLSVFIPIFIHKNILTKALYRSTPGERAKSEWWWQTEKYDYVNYNYKSHFVLVPGAAHWWIRWGEVWPARCRSLRMMSPGSLPSNWLVWSSPSSSLRQDWSVVQLSVAGFWRGKVITESMVVCYCNHALYNILLSGFVTRDHEPFQNKRANDQSKVHSEWSRRR